MTTRPIVALDIGATKIACAIGLPHEAAPGFELLGASCIPYSTISSTWLNDPLLVGRTIEEALEATAVAGAFPRAVVAVNHPALVGDEVRAMIQLGDEPIVVRAQDLARLQAGALHQALGMDREPLLVERLACSGNGFEGVRDPRGLSATRLAGTFHVVTIPMAARRLLVQAVESAGVEIARLTYTLPALLAGATEASSAHQRILLLDAGGVSVDVGLFVEGALHALVTVPWGGVTLAEQVASSLQVTLDQATTWSLEGLSCRRPEVRPLLEARWEALAQSIRQLLDGRPKPDALLVAGRASLMDGFVEWLERTLTIPASLARSGRTSRMGDLTRQVGLTAAIGLLEQATQTTTALPAKPQRLFNRLIHETRTLLMEYF